jgi:hypothetical protein
MLLDPILSRFNPVHSIAFIYLQLTSIFGEVEGNEDGKCKDQGFLKKFVTILWWTGIKITTKKASSV